MGFGKFIDGLNSEIGNQQQIISPNDFQSNGFIVSQTPSADGIGLPSSKVTSIADWLILTFVPLIIFAVWAAL